MTGEEKRRDERERAEREREKETDCTLQFGSPVVHHVCDVRGTYLHSVSYQVLATQPHASIMYLIMYLHNFKPDPVSEVRPGPAHQKSKK